MSNNLESTNILNLAEVKACQKATWEAGDFGRIARMIENVAEEFMARQPLHCGSRVLDVACGTGNLALIAARRGCVVCGIDIASNLIEQARARAPRKVCALTSTKVTPRPCLSPAAGSILW